MRSLRRLGVALVLLSAGLLAASCASHGAHLRAQPVMFMETPSDGKQRTISVKLPPIEEAVPAQDTAAAQLASLGGRRTQVASLHAPPLAFVEGPARPAEDSSLEIKCVRSWNFLGRNGSTGEANTEDAATDQCLYMSVDMDKLFEQPIRNAPERNRIVFLLVNVSDSNCSTFLHRFYASKAGLDAARDTGKDIATAIAAGTAKVASGLSGAIGLINLAGGTAVDNVDKSFFSEKAVQAITAAISSLRATSKKRLLDASKKPLAEYSYFEALNHLEEYDQDCSLQRGVEQLAELANHASINAEAQLRGTQAANVEELRKDLEAARRERDDAVRLRAESQQQLIKAKDEAERAALLEQIKTLTTQVQKATEDVNKLRSALPTGAPATAMKPDDLVTPTPPAPAPPNP